MDGVGDCGGRGPISDNVLTFHDYLRTELHFLLKRLGVQILCLAANKSEIVLSLGEKCLAGNSLRPCKKT